MEGTKMPMVSRKRRLAWVSPGMGILILAYGLFYMVTSSANVASIGIAATALGTGWLLGSLLSEGIVRAEANAA